MTVKDSTVTIHNVNIQTTMRPLTSEEISALAQQQARYDAWQEAVGLAKSLYGDRVHHVVVHYDGSFDDEGKYCAYPQGITTHDREGHPLPYDFEASFWQTRLDKEKSTPYEQIKARVRARENAEWQENWRERVGKLITRNRALLNESVSMPLYEGTLKEMPTTFTFLTDIEPAPAVCPLYNEHTPEQRWHEEAEAWLHEIDIFPWAIENRDDFYNHFTVDQPPRRHFPIVYVPVLADSNTKKED